MDVEKAREQLQDADSILNANVDFMIPVVLRDVQSRIEAALCALDGAGAEEWWARSTIAGTWRVLRQGCCTPEEVAQGMDEATARRIARLPALERAAEHAVRFLERSGGADPASEHETVREALYGALKQEGP